MQGQYLTGIQPNDIPEEVDTFINSISTEPLAEEILCCQPLRCIGWIKQASEEDGSLSFTSKVYYVVFKEAYTAETRFMPCPSYHFDKNWIYSRGQSVYSTIKYNLQLHKDTALYCILEVRTRFNPSTKVYWCKVVKHSANFLKSIDAVLRMYCTRDLIIESHNKIYHAYKLVKKDFKYNLTNLDKVSPDLLEYNEYASNNN